MDEVEIRNRIQSKGLEIYLRTIPPHYVSLSRPRTAKNKLVRISTPIIQSNLVKSLPSSNSIISVEMWPHSYRIYVASATIAETLINLKSINIDNYILYFSSSSSDGILVKVSNLQSLWTDGDLTEFANLFGENVIMAYKSISKSGGYTTTGNIIFEKIPTFMVENSFIKLSELFPAISWHTTLKATCEYCHFTGHLIQHCPFSNFKPPPSHISSKNISKHISSMPVNKLKEPVNVSTSISPLNLSVDESSDSDTDKSYVPNLNSESNSDIENLEVLESPISKISKFTSSTYSVASFPPYSPKPKQFR